MLRPTYPRHAVASAASDHMRLVTPPAFVVRAATLWNTLGAVLACSFALEGHRHRRPRAVQ